MSVSGTQAGTATLGATSVTLPEVRETGSVVNVAERLIIVGAEVDAVDRRHQRLLANAEQPFLHVAQDFCDEIVPLQTTRGAAGHKLHFKQH